jgi:hypothetical protein
VKPWYSKIAVLDWFLFWTGIVSISGFVGSYFSALQSRPALTLSTTILGAGLGLVIGLLAIALILGSRRVVRYCFPIATFAIGQGLKRYRLGENIRWVVVVGFAMSMAVSALFALVIPAGH